MTDKLPITVMVFVKNEEAGLGRTLASTKDFDEVIVIDSHSTDRTVEIAEQYGATVVQFDWNGRYPKKKQWSFDNAGAKHDWVLMLDGDEVVTTGLVQEFRGMVDELAAKSYGGYDARLRYKFAGKFLDHGHKVVKRILIDTTVARFSEVDDLGAPGYTEFEIEQHVHPQTEAPTRWLSARLEHDDRDPVDSWFDRHNRYSGWEAHLRSDQERYQLVAGNRSAQGKFWSKVPFKPVVFFVYSYFGRAGFLDGRAGFDYAFAQSAYYWQIGLKLRENRRLRAEQPEPVTV